MVFLFLWADPYPLLEGLWVYFAIHYYFLLTSLFIVETDMWVKCNNYYMNTETVNKKRGRPALGNVLFAKRVSPETAAELEEIAGLRKKGVPRSEAPLGFKIKPPTLAPLDEAKVMMVADVKQTMELNEIKKQLEAMTASYDGEFKLRGKLELDLEAANQELENWFMKDESSKVRWLAAQWNLCKQAGGRNEFDQTQG